MGPARFPTVRVTAGAIRGGKVAADLAPVDLVADDLAPVGLVAADRADLVLDARLEPRVVDPEGLVDLRVAVPADPRVVDARAELRVGDLEDARQVAGVVPALLVGGRQVADSAVPRRMAVNRINEHD